MKKTFISHPYTDNPAENKEKVEIICRLLYEQSLFPLSPLHLFSFIDKETSSLRGLIMDTCFKMIAYDAEQLYAFGREGGCKTEIRWAKKLDVPIYFKKLIEEDGEYKIIDVC